MPRPPRRVAGLNASSAIERDLMRTYAATWGDEMRRLAANLSAFAGRGAAAGIERDARSLASELDAVAVTNGPGLVGALLHRANEESGTCRPVTGEVMKIRCNAVGAAWIAGRASRTTW